MIDFGDVIFDENGNYVDGGERFWK